MTSTLGPRAIVFGDFNATPWTSAFESLIEQTRLRDTRAGFGLQPSWPTEFASLRIPIDHCLIGSDLTTIDRKLGPDIGSDHLPLIVELGRRGQSIADR